MNTETHKQTLLWEIGSRGRPSRWGFLCACGEIGKRDAISWREGRNRGLEMAIGSPDTKSGKHLLQVRVVPRAFNNRAAPDSERVLNSFSPNTCSSIGRAMSHNDKKRVRPSPGAIFKQSSSVQRKQIAQSPICGFALQDSFGRRSRSPIHRTERQGPRAEFLCAVSLEQVQRLEG